MSPDIITSRQNQWIKRLLEAERGKGEWGALCIPEGLKLCREADETGLSVRAVFAVPALREEALRLGGPDTLRFTVADGLFAKVAETVNPQGILLVAERPRIGSLADLDARRAPKEADILVLENIQDPGNLGTMLRTAMALGWAGAVLVGHTADPFRSKAMRAAMGTSFRFPLYEEKESSKMASYCKKTHLPIVTAALEGEALPSFKREAALSLWIGNEGSGLSAEALEAADRKVTIPMPGAAESLNAAAAAAILMYRLREERL